MIPRRGFSQLDLEGKPFFCPEANHAFIDTLKANLRKDIPIIEMDVDINDPAFSGKSAEILLSMLQKERYSEKKNIQSSSDQEEVMSWQPFPVEKYLESYMRKRKRASLSLAEGLEQGFRQSAKRPARLI